MHITENPSTFYTSAPAIATSKGIMSSGCLSVMCPIFVNTISQERHDGNSSNLEQIFTQPQGCIEVVVVRSKVKVCLTY